MHAFPDPFGPTPEECLADALLFYELAEMWARNGLHKRTRRTAELIAQGTHVRSGRGFIAQARRRLSVRRHCRGAYGKPKGLYIAIRAGNEVVRLSYA